MSSEKSKKKRDDYDSRRAGGQSGYVPLPLLGQIREKGFSSESEARRQSFVSAPQPSVTPFPIARHRSEGPHWAPLQPPSAHNVSQSPENPDDAIGENAAFVAQPLVRKKKETIDFSKWKAGRNKNIGDNISIPSEKEVIPHTQIKENILEAKIEILKGLQLGEYAQVHSIQSADGELYSIEDRDELEIHSAQSTEDIEGISENSEMSLGGMTAEQIIEAQQELTERFRPDILDMLRRRGKAKAEGQKSNSEMPVKKGSLPMPDIIKVNKKEDIHDEVIGKTRIAKVQDDSSRDTSISSAPANIVESVAPERITATAQMHSGLSYVDWKNMPWTDRVEAVRSFKFGLDGSFIGHGSTTVSTSLGGDKSVLLNATERDFLRTEGDPTSDGYTVKEAIALVRSMVPAQRSAGLRIVSHILEKALIAFQSNSCERGIEVLASSFDWQAVWAYALGPEPELVLTLRLALDDSHATAIVTCARALEYLLSSSANEQYFHLCECLWPGGDHLFTAPIFQKPSFQESGLIGDCYWKYNVKPSDMFNFSSSGKSEKGEDDSSVDKDSSIANQDVAAGLIRMGILPRIRYILEVDRLLAAEDSLFSILIALARHSPSAADAVMKCPRLMDTIMQLFVQDGTFTWPSRAKAIKLLKVLSIAKKSNCIEIFNSGLFQAAQLGLSREGLNLGPAKRIYNGHQGSGIDLVEALNFWRVCIKYSLGILCFSDLYPALLYWISAPDVVLSVEGTVEFEHSALTVSSFQLLEALANTLPVLHVASESELTEEANVDSWDTSSAELDVWSWKFAIPIVENSLDWLSSELIHACIQSLQQQNGRTAMLFRMLSSILHFLSTVCGRILEDRKCKPAWLPTFVPKLALQLVKSNLLDFSTNVYSELSRNTLVKCFVSRKEQLLGEELLHFTDCLHGLVRLLKVVDHLFISVKMDTTNPEPDCTSEAESLEIEGTLRGGLAVSAKSELMQLLKCLGDCLIKQTGMLNMLDTSRRGGPAPGIGIGWGCEGGGYWSIRVLTIQVDSVLLLELIELFPGQEIPSVISKELPHLNEDIDMFAIDSIWRIKVGLSAILLAGPHQRNLIENICHSLIFHNSALDLFCSNTKALIRKWLRKLELDTMIQIDSYLSDLNLHIEEMRDILCQHVRNVWFQKKKKVSDKYITAEAKISKRTSALPTVHEGNVPTSGRKDSLAVEWAAQKLPLPSFWFLSPLLSNVCIQIESGDGIKNGKFKDENLNVVTVTSHGLVLLFGLETLSDGSLSVGLDVSIARKIHALSNVFILSDDIFLEKPVRSMIGALQELYMDFLPLISDQNLELGDIDYLNVAERTIAKHSTFSLDFETLVDQRYTSFIDRLTNQFAAVSYGDLVFGRQIAIYLTRNVPDSLRLRVWKSLETEHMLEFLPPIEQCSGKATVYLHPFEENQEIIKCYASAWAKGALDRAKIRNSVSFSLAQFHVASFIFKADDDQNQLLRKTVAKDLLVGLARRPQFQDSLRSLFNYDEYYVIPGHAEKKDLRYVFLEEVCMDSPNLLAQIRLLKSL